MSSELLIHRHSHSRLYAHIGGGKTRLTGIEFLVISEERSHWAALHPLLSLSVRPRGELRIRRNHAKPLLVGERSP